MKKKVISLLAVLALCLAFAVPAFAADTQYKVGDYVSYSGHTDFGYYYTYTVKDVNYKCFSVVSADGQRYYASVKESLYEYFKGAFANQDITFRGAVQSIAGDGAPVINAYRFSAVTGLLRFFCPITLTFAGFLSETAYNLRKRRTSCIEPSFSGWYNFNKEEADEKHAAGRIVRNAYETENKKYRTVSRGDDHGSGVHRVLLRIHPSADLPREHGKPAFHLQSGDQDL